MSDGRAAAAVSDVDDVQCSCDWATCAFGLRVPDTDTGFAGDIVYLRVGSVLWYVLRLMLSYAAGYAMCHFFAPKHR